MKLQMGDRIKVLDLGDETIDRFSIGKEGIIIDINTNKATGNTKDDPLYEIFFDDGLHGSYWTKELELIEKGLDVL